MNKKLLLQTQMTWLWELHELIWSWWLIVLICVWIAEAMTPAKAVPTGRYVMRILVAILAILLFDVGSKKRLFTTCRYGS
jgi:hypothetical protein